MSRSILIVDDNEMFRGMLRSLLAMRGFEAVMAANGQEGLAIAASRPIDAVLSDVDMPGMDGIEFCAQLRALAQKEGKDIPVWIMTGGMRPGMARRAAAAGALLVVRKPFNVVDVCNQIQQEFEARSSRPPMPPAGAEPAAPAANAAPPP
jgi:CheY-like chemotaxis protein